MKAKDIFVQVSMIFLAFLLFQAQAACQTNIETACDIQSVINMQISKIIHHAQYADNRVDCINALAQIYDTIVVINVIHKLRLTASIEAGNHNFAFSFIIFISGI